MTDRGRTFACSGCGGETPWDEGWQEWLTTPLGRASHRCHRRRECVVAGRERVAAVAGGPVRHFESRARGPQVS